MTGQRTVAMTKRWTWWLVGLALGILALILWLALRSTPPAAGVIVVNGRIEGDQAAVGAKVGGKVVHLAIREGDQVTAGEPIAQLASEQTQAQLEQAKHIVHTAREQLTAAQARVAAVRSEVATAQTAIKLAHQESQAWIGEAQAALETARARLRQAEADLEKAANDYTRYRELFAKKVIAAQQLDAAKAAYERTQAAVEAAREQVTQGQKTLERASASRVTIELRRQEAQTARERLAEARAAVETARARLQTAEAGLKLAQANLHDTRVLAPFAGTVLRRFVEPGEVVAAGTPLITLVDLSRLHAKVYVAEADLGKLKIGDPARVYADAFPERYFDATVAQVAQQAEFTPRDIHMPEERTTLVFAVKLAIRNPQGLLKPGMPVDGRIRWRPQAPWGDGMDG
jgi:HlyD family secretion protein